jgi:hypothetical protein
MLLTQHKEVDMAEDAKNTVVGESGPSEEEGKVFTCARCGWNPEGNPAPSEEDTQEYLRCILGSKPFYKEYELYDGQIKITYRTCNNKEVDGLNDILFDMNKDVEQGELQDKSIKLKLLYFLSDIKLGDKNESYTIPELKHYVDIDDAFNERFADVAEPVIRMMTQSMFLFMELQQTLVADGFDSNFWKGAGLRSR